MIKGIPKIASLENSLVKHLVKLRENKKYRFAHGAALVCGRQLIEELSQFLTPHLMLLQENIERPTGIIAHKHFTANEKILKKVSNLPAPDGFAAVFPLLPAAPLFKKSRVLALDGVRDPGNLGTLIRTALALGWDGLFLLPGCVDPFHEKAIRSSRGGSFKLPWQSGTWEDLSSCIQKNGLISYCADVNGRDCAQVAPQENILLLLSNESKGISKMGETIGEKLSVPIMREKMESLNVSAAGAILMFQLLSK